MYPAFVFHNNDVLPALRGLVGMTWNGTSEMGKRQFDARFGGWTMVTALLCASIASRALASGLPVTASGPANQACEQCPAARQGIDLLMNGDPDSAIEIFKQIQAQEPDSPLGYVAAADALWWKIYLTTADLIDPDVFDVVYSKTSPYDALFEEMVNTAIRKGSEQIRAGHTVARNRLYAGMAYALRARYYGLRDQDLATARAAKRMRALLLLASRDDPALVDTNAGLGLYNYFVDTLPTIVKMLRFFIGLPGGSRDLGLQQLQNAAANGDLARGEAKFYLAKDFSRASERQYAASLQLFQELSKEYPRNLLWKLLIGSLEARLGNAGEAETNYRVVLENSADKNSEVQQALHREVEKALQRLHPEGKAASIVR